LASTVDAKIGSQEPIVSAEWRIGRRQLQTHVNAITLLDSSSSILDPTISINSNGREKKTIMGSGQLFVWGQWLGMGWRACVAECHTPIFMSTPDQVSPVERRFEVRGQSIASYSGTCTEFHFDRLQRQVIPQGRSSRFFHQFFTTSHHVVPSTSC